MTDEMVEPGPKKEPDIGTRALDALTTTIGGSHKTGEGRVALAGLVLLAVWLIFDVIINNYGVDNTLAVLAAAALIFRRMDSDKPGGIPRPAIMKMLGYAIALFGVIEVILDVRFAVYEEPASLVGALAGYASFALAFIGARSIKLGDAPTE